MRIITENVQSYIQSLAAAVTKDPASMENWRCLHVAHIDDVSFLTYERVLKGIKNAHHAVDCDMVHCADNDVLFISRSMNAGELYEISAELIEAECSPSTSKIGVTLYDLFSEWRSVRNLLLSKAPEAINETSSRAIHNFGELSSLSTVFSEVKNKSKARAPLHILLVEDDPITRRLVGGIFKEKYALITAENAQEAITNYLLYAPDIVFLDIGLPDASGMDVLHAIMDSDPEAYVVMFSGNSYLDNVTTALGAGASGFIAKPFKKDKIQHYIKDGALHHHKLA